MNNKINSIHEKALRVASKDTASEFETLLHNKIEKTTSTAENKGKMSE